MTTGPFSVPLSVLRSMLSESGTFIDWTSSDDAAEALGSIHYANVEEDDIVRPLAVIDIGEHWQSDLVAAGVNGLFANSGEIILFFEANVADGATEGAALISFLDKVGGCVQDLQELSGEGGYIAIHSITMDEPPSRSTDDEEPPEGDFYRIKLVAEWGV